MTSVDVQPLPSVLRLLQVEDNDADADLTAERLAALPDLRFELVRATSVRAALHELGEQQPFDGVLLDLNLDDTRGLDTLHALRPSSLSVPVVVLCGETSDSLRAEALAAGALLVLDKDELADCHLPRSVLFALERHRALLQQAQIERLVAETPAGILVVDGGGVVRLVNDAALDLFGRCRKDFVGELLGFSVPDAETAVIELVRRGEARIAEMRVAPFEWRGDPASLVSIRDVTAEQQAAELRTRLHHVVTSSPAVLYSLLIEGDRRRLHWMSDNLERLTGYTTADAYEEGWWRDHIHPADRRWVLDASDAVLTDGFLTREYRFRTRDGSYRWIRDEQRLIPDSDDGRREVVGSWTDTTRGKTAEIERRRQEEEYRLLFESNPQPMWVLDLESHAFLAVNAAMVDYYGWSREELLAMTFPEIVAPEDRAFARGVRAGEAFTPRHVKKDGTVTEVEMVSNVLAFQGRSAQITLATDVTERRNLQAQLLQSQKMESIGRLAGGVAHDFNNLLGVITGYGQLLRERIAGDPLMEEFTEEILKAADRAASLTRHLLIFSRRGVLDPAVLDLNQVVQSVTRIFSRVLGEDLKLSFRLEESLPPVHTDAGQLEQAIMNLAVNARDAMPQGGSLMIETSTVFLDEHYASQHAEVRPGRYAMLAVSDTGEGMAPEVQAKIFEPFFTTKEPGKGTGLGLAMVHGFVRQSGGHIYVYSEIGRGSTFKVYLPAVAGITDSPRHLAPPKPPGGSETVLVVEDEGALRELVRVGLEASGYTVLQAEDGMAAREICTKHAAPIHLLLTDVVMPGIGGRELAVELRARRPALRVLFMSGYTTDAVVTRGILEGSVPFLQKPFNLTELAQAVRKAIDAEPAFPGG